MWRHLPFSAPMFPFIFWLKTATNIYIILGFAQDQREKTATDGRIRGDEPPNSLHCAYIGRIQCGRSVEAHRRELYHPLLFLSSDGPNHWKPQNQVARWFEMGKAEIPAAPLFGAADIHMATYVSTCKAAPLIWGVWVVSRL